jgi:uncharacterized protein (TIGR04562 family)
MTKLAYLSKYQLNWETFDVLIGGKSALDTNSYLAQISGTESVNNYLKGYGFDVSDPIQKAELFGNFQEALQFIKRFFLKEGNSDGLDLKIPTLLYTITDATDLFLLASGKYHSKATREESIWAGIILKVMHTILHTDKDLRYRYFSTVQLQIFDRFYRYVVREGDQLFLKDEQLDYKIPLVDFETKAKKTRESIIIKLLHKKENVAEELFDRIGVRFITYKKSDVLRVLKFLYNNYIITAHNVKPSRSINTLIDMSSFRNGYYSLIKKALRENLSEAQFELELENLAQDCSLTQNRDQMVNTHTSQDYRAIHFTCRQLIKYRNPFMDEFLHLKKIAKKTSEGNELAQKILQLDTSSIATDVRFFYPFEVQVTDYESHLGNTAGEASHAEYKKSQVKSAMKRIFKLLLEYKGIEI